MNLIKLIPCIYKRFWPSQPLYFRFWIFKKYIYVHECCQANQNSSIDHLSLILGRIIKVLRYESFQTRVVILCSYFFFSCVFATLYNIKPFSQNFSVALQRPCKYQNCWKSTPSDSPILSIFCRLSTTIGSSLLGMNKMQNMIRQKKIPNSVSSSPSTLNIFSMCDSFLSIWFLYSRKSRVLPSNL